MIYNSDYHIQMDIRSVWCTVCRWQRETKREHHRKSILQRETLPNAHCGGQLLPHWPLGLERFRRTQLRGWASINELTSLSLMPAGMFFPVFVFILFFTLPQLITSAKEAVFSVPRVCLFVRVRRIYQRFLTLLNGFLCKVRPHNKWLVVVMWMQDFFSWLIC